MSGLPRAFAQPVEHRTSRRRRVLLIGLASGHLASGGFALPARAQPERAGALRRSLVPLAGTQDVRPVLDALGSADTVLLGEATHGSREFYRLRAELTRALILERAFDAVLVEGGWPAAARAHRYAQGKGSDRNAEQALAGFSAFPSWVWRNSVVRDWLAWLRDHNLSRGDRRERVGFHGLDLQSLGGSIDAVLLHLQGEDPAAAERARQRYACFKGYAERPERYGRAANLGLARCEEPAVAQFEELSAGGPPVGGAEAKASPERSDAAFAARHNARVVRDAEAYYRSAAQDRTAAWNLRDTHMADTVDVVRARLQAERRRPARIVVWAHNSHVGDARATSAGAAGELSLGQLLRQRAGRPGEVALIGMSTHAGRVTAAPGWGEAPENMALAPSLPGSVERALHDCGVPAFLLRLGPGSAAAHALDRPLPQRAVGVVYRPDSERGSHYFEAVLPEQYDAIVHFDHTDALEPLD